jgi:hypothetical protein
LPSNLSTTTLNYLIRFYQASVFHFHQAADVNLHNR